MLSEAHQVGLNTTRRGVERGHGTALDSRQASQACLIAPRLGSALTPGLLPDGPSYPLAAAAPRLHMKFSEKLQAYEALEAFHNGLTNGKHSYLVRTPSESSPCAERPTNCPPWQTSSSLRSSTMASGLTSTGPSQSPRTRALGSCWHLS
jgi:hypothetical protein